MGQGRRLSADVKETLELVAPGTELRAAIENVILAGNGGLMVFADPAELGGRVVSGGMRLGCDLTPMRLYELSKMDGAIVVSPDLSTIHRANAQLTPDPDIPSQETGLRHLAAHRTACQTGALAIAISIAARWLRSTPVSTARACWTPSGWFSARRSRGS